MTWMHSRSSANVCGRAPSVRSAESPRPMPQIVRLPNMLLSVANVDAVTVASRVPGFVTIGPTITVDVAARIWLQMTYGSCHSRCESNVHTCENPAASACCASRTTSLAGGSSWKTTPMSISDQVLRESATQVSATALHAVQNAVVDDYLAS